jgi:hypothetical protein
MDFEQQKPITDEYRENYDKVFGGRGYTWAKHAPPIRGSLVADLRKEKSVDSAGTYKNGCPILSDGPQKDDL